MNWSGSLRGITQRHHKQILAAGFLLGSVLLGGCASTQSAPITSAAPLEISPATDGALQKYLGAVAHNPGAFAVSVDGNNSYMGYCPERVCTNNFFVEITLKRCQSLSGQKCVLLFSGRQPRQAYSVAADRNTSGLHGSREGVPREWFFPF
jgi:hypothetical protein